MEGYVPAREGEENSANFSAAEDAETALLRIERFIETIPNPNRAEAIAAADARRRAFLEKIWERERGKLPEKIIAEHGLIAGQEGWARYLAFAYSSQDDYQKQKFGLEEWAVKYTYEMLSELEQDASYVARKEGWGEAPNEEVLKVPGSYLDRHAKFGFFNLAIGHARMGPIDSDSLLVHALSEESLEKVIESGVVGAGGLSYCAMSQDRVVYDDGYVIVFQAKDLLAAGYPLLQVNEDGRDAHILKEWRSIEPIDVRLARLVAPTSVIPDRKKIANNPQIAQTFCGEDFLRQIPRL